MLDHPTSLFQKFKPLFINNSMTISHYQVKPAEKDELKADLAMRKAITLYEVSDAEGTVKIVEVKTGPLSQPDLKTAEAYIVDHGSFGIWCWVGKSASLAERREALKNAQGFIGKKGYPVHTPITRVTLCTSD